MSPERRLGCGKPNKLVMLFRKLVHTRHLCTLVLISLLIRTRYDFPRRDAAFFDACVCVTFAPRDAAEEGLNVRDRRAGFWSCCEAEDSEFNSGDGEDGTGYGMLDMERYSVIAYIPFFWHSA